MAIYTNKYAQQVFEILAPFVGDLMAKGVVKSQAALIGEKPESLKKEDMPKLAEKVKKGMAVFLGSDSALKIAERIARIV